MKITILQETIEKALQLINRIAVLKTQLPITNNILIKAKNGDIEVTGTDLESTIHIILSGVVEKKGAMLIPTRTLIDVITVFPKEQVTFEEINLITTLKSGANTVNINGLSADEFPSAPPIVEKERIRLDDIMPFAKTVAFAAATEESRAVYTGIYVKFENDQLTLVATDGYRLSLKRMLDVGGSKRIIGEQAITSLIIPARIFTEIAKIVSEKGEAKEVFLILGDLKNQAVFKTDNITIYTRLIEGTFPAYEKIIPSSWNTRVALDKEELFKAVKLSSIFARESANIIKITIESDHIVLSANAPQVGDNVCRVEGKIEGEENEIAFNSRFLQDFLNATNSHEIVFEMTGPLNPGVFKIPGDDSYLHIIMPVRVQG